MKKQNVILMVANSDTAMNGFLALQECFESIGNIKSVIVCHWRVHVDSAVKRCEIPKEKIRILNFYSHVPPTKGGQQKEYQYRQDVLLVALLKAIYNVVKIVGQNMVGLIKARNIIKNVNPSIILLYADNKAECEKFFIFWARKKKIKTIIAPICNSTITVGDILINPSNGFRIDINDKLPISAKIVRRMKPKEERVVKEQRVFLGQPFSTIIDCCMGLSAPNPWVQGSFADIVCTSYQEEYDAILGELGKEAKEKLFLTDSIEDDIIIQKYSDRKAVKHFLNEKYGVDVDLIVMVAFSERIGCVFKEDDLYNKDVIVQSMLKYYKDVLISLHPKSDVEENRFLEKYEGCHILDEPLRKVVAAADVIAYGDVSSVGRWADMLGIWGVTWPSYSMWEKWTPSITQDFQNKVKAVAEDDKTERTTIGLERNMSFVDFILNLI